MHLLCQLKVALLPRNFPRDLAVHFELGFISACLYLPKGNSVRLAKVTWPTLGNWKCKRIPCKKTNAIWQSFEVCKFGNKLNWFQFLLEFILSNAIKRFSFDYGNQSYWCHQKN